MSEQKYISYNQTLIKKVRQNRGNMPKPEQKVWYEVLNNKKLGYKFLRQKPIGNYIVDFYCSKLLLAVEIDGDTHAKQEEYDQERTDYLNEKNIRVIRYYNPEVMKNIEFIWEDITQQIRKREQEFGLVNSSV